MWDTAEMKEVGHCREGWDTAERGVRHCRERVGTHCRERGETAERGVRLQRERWETNCKP